MDKLMDKVSDNLFRKLLYKLKGHNNNLSKWHIRDTERLKLHIDNEEHSTYKCR